MTVIQKDRYRGTVPDDCLRYAIRAYINLKSIRPCAILEIRIRSHWNTSTVVLHTHAMSPLGLLVELCRMTP